MNLLEFLLYRANRNRTRNTSLYNNSFCVPLKHTLLSWWVSSTLVLAARQMPTLEALPGGLEPEHTCRRRRRLRMFALGGFAVTRPRSGTASDGDVAGGDLAVCTGRGSPWPAIGRHRRPARWEPRAPRWSPRSTGLPRGECQVRHCFGFDFTGLGWPRRSPTRVLLGGATLTLFGLVGRADLDDGSGAVRGVTLTPPKSTSTVEANRFRWSGNVAWGCPAGLLSPPR